MKRYWLFAFDHYYPTGGVGDLIERFDTLDDAIAASKGLNMDAWQVVDVLAEDLSKCIVADKRRGRVLSSPPEK